MYWLAVERLLLTIWVGALVAIGYLAAPILFNSLDDRMLAGMLAGKMFSAVSVIGLLIGWVLLVSAIYHSAITWFKNWRVWVLAVMLLLVAVGMFWIQPMMADLKAAGLAADSTVASRFGMLHGVSSTLYMITTIGGLSLVLAGLGARKEV